ncbi:MAG: hypothetical protein Q4G65_06875, partial [bacterium]|nr:hypothetical protein [bacterium]
RRRSRRNVQLRRVLQLPHSRVYLNGELVDPQHTRVLKDQLSLHEYEFLHNGRASAFYNERFLNGKTERTGGDNLCEVVIFTNRLTEVDRLAVGAYLSDKWLGRTARPLPLVLASEAAVQFDAEQMPFGVSGTGVLSLENGSFSLTNRIAQTFHGSVSIGSGATVQVGPALPVKAVSGTAIRIDDNVATVAAGSEKTITKTGNGALTLASVPENTERLVVSAGSLTLSGARRGSEVVSGTILEPLLADASFEELTTAAFQRMQSADFSYPNGVRVFVPDRGAENAEGSYGGPYRTLSNESSVGGSYPAPHGEYAMFLSRMASCSIPLTFYADGVYRLAFSARARSTSRQGQRHNIKIVQDGVTNLVGRITTWGDQFFRYAFLTPRLVAGPATLLLEGVGERENGVLLNAGSLFDDIQLAYYGQTPEKVVAVPNGDFEADYQCPISSSAVRAMPSFSVANTIAGWTFAQGTTYDEHPTWGPQIGIAQPFMGSGSVKNCQFFNLGENRFGMSQLTLFGPGASAQTDPFAVPAGRYRVRADIGWFTVTQPNGGASNTSYVDTQKVDVSVKVGEGCWIQIGTLSTVNKLFTPTFVNDEFAVNAGEMVSLKFETTVSRGCMLMDNVVLVPQEGALPLATGTKVLDNSRPALWPTRVANTGEGGSSSGVTTRGYSTEPALNYFGVELCPAIPNLNTQFLILTQRGSASTSVTFPVAGRYRLSVWAAQRHDMTGQRDRANCPFEVWLKDVEGRVRSLGRTRVDHDNYHQYVFTFDVTDVRAPYVLGLQGAQSYSADDPSNNHSVRLDCVDLEFAGDSFSDVELPENLAIDVADGSTLRLDFLGTNTVGSLRVAGKNYAGYVSAADRPDLGNALTGPGTLYILPRGTILIFR